MAEVRLLQVMAGARIGGAETFFVRLAVALQKRDLTQRVVIRNHNERACELVDNGVDTVQIPFRGIFRSSTMSALQREIDGFEPTVVLSWMSRAASLTPPGDHRFLARLGGYYDLKHYRRCDHLICNTNHIADYVRSGGWPPERVHYLPNFTTFGPIEAVARETFETPADVPLVLVAGRLHGNKGFDVLLQAMAQVPSAWLWLAGEGPSEPKLRKMIDELGLAPRVRMVGWRDDINRLMAACDLVVCSSRLEPLGNVVLEAWAAGKPIVAAKASGPATLIDDGENGLLADIDDAVGLAQRIRAVLGDEKLARQLVSGGMLTFEENFTEAAVVDQYLALFNRVLA